MNLTLDLNNVSDYRTFLKVKSLPVYRFTGRDAWFPDEYAGLIGIKTAKPKSTAYEPREWLFDYQRDIAKLAIQKRKYAVFADCLTVIDGMIEEMKRLKKVVAENQKLVSVLIDGARTGKKEKTK